jgi:uncharacterized membrane protein YphA (DoxX/SURF4 family)
MALPPLNIKIGADTIDLEKSLQYVRDQMEGLKRATDSVAGGLRSFGDGATSLGKRMLPLSAGITAAAGGMFLLAKGTADAGDEIAKSARAAGVSADALQELRFALGQAAGVGEQQTSTMLTTLTRRMGEATAGNDTYAAALASLGISLEDVASGAVTTDQVFMALTDAMQGAGSDAEAAAMGMELLGREGAALGGKLRGAEADLGGLRDRAQELGIVLSGDTLAASEAFNDKMDELTRQMGAARAQIGQALLPVALSLATAFQDKVVPAIVSVAEGVANAIEWFGQLPGPVQEAASLVATALGVGGPVLLAIGALSKALSGLLIATGPIGLLIGAAALLTAAWIKWGDDIIEITGEAVDWITEKFNGLVEFFTGIPERFFEFGRNMIEGLRMGIDSAWEAVKESIREKVDWLPNWVKDRLGIASPSRVFMEIGENIGEGMAIGIQNTFGMVQSAVQGLGNVVTSGAFDMAQGVVSAMGQMFQGSKPIAAAQALINTFQGITEALKTKDYLGAAKIAAQGFAAVASIRSARPSGSQAIQRPSSSGGGSFSGGGAGGGMAQSAQAPTTTFRFTIQNDSFGFGESFARQLVDQLNEASRNGGQIRGVLG